MRNSTMWSVRNAAVDSSLTSPSSENRPGLNWKVVVESGL
jgi:hypothetical protein